MNLVKWWKDYGKATVAVLVLVAYSIQAALSDATTGGKISASEAIGIAIALMMAFGVYLVPIIPQYPWTKSVIVFALAILDAAAAAIVDGWTSADLTTIVFAGATALGVAVAPARINTPARTRVPVA
jgi:hypothetical protein